MSSRVNEVLSASLLKLSDAESALIKYLRIDESDGDASLICQALIIEDDPFELLKYRPRFNGGRLPSDFTPAEREKLLDFSRSLECKIVCAKLSDILYGATLQRSYILTALNQYIESLKLMAGDWTMEELVIWGRAFRLARSMNQPLKMESLLALIVDDVGVVNIHGAAINAVMICRTLIASRVAQDKNIVSIIDWMLSKFHELTATDSLPEIRWQYVLLLRSLLRDRQGEWLQIVDEHHDAEFDRIGKMQQAAEKVGALERLHAFVLEVEGKSPRAHTIYESIEREGFRTLSQFERFAHEYDASEPYKSVLADMQSSTDEFDALMRMLKYARPIGKDTMYAEVHRAFAVAPFLSMIQIRHTSDDGLSELTVPGYDVSDPNNEEIIDKRAIHMFAYETVAFVYLPLKIARDYFVEHYGIPYNLIRHLVSSSPFVPHGQKEYWYRGLIAGFYDDGVGIVSYLVDNVEGCLRTLAKQANVDWWYFNATGQMRTSGQNVLRGLVEHEKIAEPYAFMLDALLYNECGTKIRHSIAHSFLSADMSESPVITFLWGTLLKLTCLGYFQQWIEAQRDLPERGVIDAAVTSTE